MAIVLVLHGDVRLVLDQAGHAEIDKEATGTGEQLSAGQALADSLGGSTVERSGCGRRGLKQETFRKCLEEEIEKKHLHYSPLES